MFDPVRAMLHMAKPVVCVTEKTLVIGETPVMVIIQNGAVPRSMSRRLGKNACDALQEYKTRGGIPYATGNVMSVRQEPGVGSEQLRLLPHKARR